MHRIKRRQFINGAIGLGASITLSLGTTPRLFAASLPSSITDFTATDLSLAIRNSQVSCVEVMQAYLAHIHRYNSTYNAIVAMPVDDNLLAQASAADQSLARGEYQGWMHGMPHAAKDLIAVAGLRYTSGSPIFADRVADTDNALVGRLRRQGAIFIGKTNTPEFGLGSQSYNAVYGATGSACNPALTSGGSSGGAASGLGTRMLPVADGSDMMGSLRNPGAFNNVIGFRPSVGIMGAGDPFSRALSTAGPMGRNTADTIRLLQTIAAPLGAEQPQSIQNALAGIDDFSSVPLRNIKIGWMGNYNGYLAMEPGVLELCEAALANVSSNGAIVDSVQPQFDMSDLWRCWIDLRNWGKTSMRNYYENSDTRPLLKPEIVWEIEQSYLLDANAIYEANRIRRRWYSELNRLFGEYDFLALPSAQVFPFPKENHWPSQINGRQMDTYHRWMEVVTGASLAGIPVINLPVGFDDQGRPMGMQIMSRYGADRKVLEFALAYEQVTDFLDQRPALVASSA